MNTFTAIQPGEPFKHKGFGNPWLTNIHEVTAPEAISLWPNSPVWWALMAVLLMWALRCAYKRYRHWQKNSYRREALHQLKSLQRRSKSTVISAHDLREIPKLIRTIAIISKGRDTIVPLTGSQWLAAINTELQQAGKAAIDDTFLQLGYLPDERLQGLPPQQLIPLLASLATWVLIHRGEPC